MPNGPYPRLSPSELADLTLTVLPFGGGGRVDNLHFSDFSVTPRVASRAGVGSKLAYT